MNTIKRVSQYLGPAAILSGAACSLMLTTAGAVTLHVDPLMGSDANPGTAGQPFKTLQKAAEKVNEQPMPGAMTIRLAGGIYALPRTVAFENRRAFGTEQRLIIEAAMSPDDSVWHPAAMPTILSIEDPGRPDQAGKITSTFGLKINMSHVTVRGLKFLGSPVPNNWYCPLECLAPDLKDVQVTQCLFVGDPDTLDIYCAVITDGHHFVVDHCIFLGCHACAVFWDGGRGVVGTGNAMRHCIVEGAKLSGVWTCDTDEDFEFHHNVVTRCEYFWLRKRGTPKTYLLRESVITDNKQYSGYAVESGATGITGPEIRFQEQGVIRVGEVALERDRGARNYLHVRRGAPGAELGAGLFANERAMPPAQ